MATPAPRSEVIGDDVNVNCTTTAGDGTTYEFVIKGLWRDPELVTSVRELLSLEGVARVKVS